MNYGLNCFIEGGRFIKLLFECKLRNANDDSVLYITVSTKDALEVLRPASNDGSIVREVVLSIRTSQRSENLMSGPIHSLHSLT